MKKSFIKGLLVTLGMSLAISGCKPESEKTIEGTQEIPVEAPSAEATPEVTNGNTFKDFDWNTVPQSTAEIGEFPYITAPDGFSITDKGHLSETKEGYSEFKEFGKLIMYNGSTFYNAEGKVAELYFRMKSANADFEQYRFDRSIDKYLEGIGAKLLTKVKLSKEQTDALNKEDDMMVYNHIVGDPWNEPVRFWALNHKNGKVMFQVFSNSASGEVGVIELEGFKQTIKAPTAVQMKKDIDTGGKAILNINFDTDKSSLKPDGQKVVDEILVLLKNNPAMNISVEGHTDNAGTKDKNKKLSIERANTIVGFLTKNGIAGKRVSATGYGAVNPLVANDSEENKAKNRRVELVKK